MDDYRTFQYLYGPYCVQYPEYGYGWPMMLDNRAPPPRIAGPAPHPTWDSFLERARTEPLIHRALASTRPGDRANRFEDRTTTAQRFPQVENRFASQRGSRGLGREVPPQPPIRNRDRAQELRDELLTQSEVRQMIIDSWRRARSPQPPATREASRRSRSPINRPRSRGRPSVTPPQPGSPPFIRHVKDARQDIKNLKAKIGELEELLADLEVQLRRIAIPGAEEIESNESD